jgi:hypothetical protein
MDSEPAAGVSTAGAPLEDAPAEDAPAAAIPGLAPSARPIADGLYDHIKLSFDLGRVQASNVIGLLTYVMAVVEKQKSLSGPEKKEVAINLVERLAGEIPGDGGVALQTAVRFLLPPFIDTIVAATRGQLDINRASAGCCSPCCLS